jgi:hypothetical protein
MMGIVSMTPCTWLINPLDPQSWWRKEREAGDTPAPGSILLHLLLILAATGGTGEAQLARETQWAAPTPTHVIPTQPIPAKAGERESISVLGGPRFVVAAEHSCRMG